MEDNVLILENISKIFPGVKALNNINLKVKRGTIHAMVGENGAGKSTLIKILAGIYQADEGTITLDNQTVCFKTPHESQVYGISVVHQELKLSETLSVAENIFLGNLIYKHGLVDWKTMYKRAVEILNSLGIDIDIYETVNNISVAKKQMVEICKAINHNCKILIMDEPSATLTENEQKIMFHAIKTLRQKGITIIYISHRLEEIFDLSDEVTVLRDGCLVDTLDIHQVDRQKLISMIIGRELTNEYPKEFFKPSDTVLEIKNINRTGVLHDISFEAKKGEILAIAGLVGSGRTEVARAILGIDKIDSGEIIYNGNIINQKDFRKAIKNGFGLVPEDRKEQGLVQILPVKENICMVNIRSILKKGIISNRLETQYANEYVNKLKVSTPSINTEVQYLSGGNQQKLVIAKWLLQNSDVIIFDEPTRGIDVGAKREIYLLLNDLVKAGKVVIIISSELPEVIGMADRIIVMNKGRIVGNLAREEFSQEKIISLCV